MTRGLLGENCSTWSKQERATYVETVADALRESLEAPLSESRLRALKLSLTGTLGGFRKSNPLQRPYATRELSLTEVSEDIKWRLCVFAARPELSSAGKAALERQIELYLGWLSTELRGGPMGGHAESIVEHVRLGIFARVENPLGFALKRPLTSEEMTKAKEAMPTILARHDRVTARRIPRFLSKERQEQLKKRRLEWAQRSCVSLLVGALRQQGGQPAMPERLREIHNKTQEQYRAYVQERRGAHRRRLIAAQAESKQRKAEPDESKLFLAEQMFLLLVLCDGRVPLF